MNTFDLMLAVCEIERRRIAQESRERAESYVRAYPEYDFRANGEPAELNFEVMS